MGFLTLVKGLFWAHRDAGSNPQLKRLEQNTSAGISGRDSWHPCECVFSHSDTPGPTCVLSFFMNFTEAPRERIQKGWWAEQLSATALEEKSALQCALWPE